MVFFLLRERILWQGVPAKYKGWFVSEWFYNGTVDLNKAVVKCQELKLNNIQEWTIKVGKETQPFWLSSNQYNSSFNAV